MLTVAYGEATLDSRSPLWLAKTEKSAPSSLECEGFAYSFLRLQGRGGS